MKEHNEKLLEELERLRFHCDKCKREWVEDRKQDQWIRSGDGTNYYIDRGQEEGPHYPINCPGCRDHTKIRRMAPPMRASTNDHTYDSKKAMTKWATNPITQEEMLGEREIP